MIRFIAVMLAGAFLCAAPALALEKDFEIAMTRGVYAVDRGEYIEAGKFLARALEVKPDDPVAITAMAIVHSRSGRYGLAERLLRRALSVSPGNSRVRYELALVLDRLGRSAEAETLRPGGGDPGVPDAAGLSVERATGNEGGERPYSLTILAGLQFDSNTVLEPSNPSYSLDRKSDWREVAALDGEWHLRRATDSDLTLGYRFYQGLNSHNRDFDLTANTVSLAGEKRFADRTRMKFSSSYRSALVSGDNYSGIVRLSTALEHSFRNNTLSFTLARELREFHNTATFPANDERSGGRFEIGVSHRMDLGRYYRFELGLLFAHDNADRNYWDNDGLTYRLTVTYRRRGWQGFVGAAYTDRGYGGVDPAVAAVRRDYVQEYSGGIIYPINHTFSLGLSETWVIYGSSIARFDYERNVSGIFVLARL